MSCVWPWNLSIYSSVTLHVAHHRTNALLSAILKSEKSDSRAGFSASTIQFQICVKYCIRFQIKVRFHCNQTRLLKDLTTSSNFYWKLFNYKNISRQASRSKSNLFNPDMQSIQRLLQEDWFSDLCGTPSFDSIIQRLLQLMDTHELEMHQRICDYIIQLHK